ncbi:MAG: hypothetical protein EXR79_08995 [Myxococcales bacterium]|nr:hypothetical protein [Myxococcales bacterium]
MMGAVAGVVAIPTTGHAGEWDDRQKDCLASFAEPAKADDKKLLACADLFSAEAGIEKLSGGEKKSIETGLRYMYDNGSDVAARRAREGLFRLDVRVPVRANRDGGGAKESAPSERKRYDPQEAKSADRAECDKLAKDGVKQIKAKKFGAAIGSLEKALQKDGRSEFALYNIACAEAHIDGKKPKAFEHLQNMADLGTDASAERLIKARTDLDFEDVRDESEFKRITGYARIQIVNTLGKSGEKGVENIEKVLVGIGHRKPDHTEEDKLLEAPVIVFKGHSKAQVALIAEILGNTQTRLDPMSGESKYDIIVKWGSKVNKETGKADSEGPANVDEAMADARKSQNKTLAKPEAAINQVNKVVDTPNRVVSNVEGMKSRVEMTGNKIKGVGDKVKALSEMPGKLEGLTKIKGL